MNRHPIVQQLVAAVVSTTMLVGQFAAVMVAPVRALKAAPDIFAVMASTILMAEAARAGETSAATQDGMSLGKSLIQSAKKPGVDSSTFSIDVTTKDGKTTRVPLGQKSDGTSYSEGDLDQYKSYYDDPSGAREASALTPSPEADFLRNNINKQSHSSRKNDPAIYTTERLLKKMGDEGLDNLYGQCGLVRTSSLAGTRDPNGPVEHCYEVESKGEQTNCQIDRVTRLAPNNGPTAILVLLEDFPFYDNLEAPGGETALEVWREQMKRFAILLSKSPQTKVAFAVPRENFYNTYDTTNREYGWYVTSPQSRPDGQPSSLNFIKGFENSLDDEAVQTAIQNMGGGTTRQHDRAELLNDADRFLHARPESNKLLIRVNGQDYYSQPAVSPSCSAKAYTYRRARACSFNRTCYRTVTVNPPAEAAQRCPTKTSYVRFNDYETFNITAIEYNQLPKHGQTNQYYADTAKQFWLSTLDETNDAAYHVLVASGHFRVDDTWTEPESPLCYRTLSYAEQSGKIQCTLPPAEDCNQLGPIKVCRGDRWSSQLTAKVYANEPLCGRVQAQMNRVEWRDRGQDYYLDQDGTTNAPLCTAFKSDPTYVKAESSCIESTKDENTGRCLVYSDVYEGGYSTTEADATAPGCVTTQEPACLDGTCIPEEGESNQDFIKIATVLQMVESAAQDIKECESGDCRFFKGTAYYCHDMKNYVPTSCCSKGTTAPTDFIAYMQAGREIWAGFQRAGGMELLKSAGLDFAGSWDYMKNVGYEVWEAVSRPVISALDSMGWSAAGNVATDAGYAAAEEAGTAFSIDGLKQYALDQTSRFLEKYYPDMASKLFEQTATDGAQAVLSEAAGQYVAMLGQMASFVMAAYMYYQLAMMAYDLYSNCDGDWYGMNMVELRTKRDKMRVCTYVQRKDKDDSFGNTEDSDTLYCCFSSPLARIVQVEARAADNLNIPFGVVGAPNCEGLTLDQMKEVDWSKVDFTEWTGILEEIGVIPTDEAGATAMTNKDLVTRNPDDPDVYNPPTSTERSDKLLGGIDWEALRDNHQDMGWDYADGAATGMDPRNRGSKAPPASDGGP